MNLRISLLLASAVAVSASALKGADLAAYRDFHLGMTLVDDQDHTQGLPDGDMIEALSGAAAQPVTAEVSFGSGLTGSKLKVIARWEDSGSQVSLVHLSYGPGFGIVISSRANKLRAEKAIIESERLDRADAPRREVALRARQLAETQAADEKARTLNKPGFRP